MELHRAEKDCSNMFFIIYLDLFIYSSISSDIGSLRALNAHENLLNFITSAVKCILQMFPFSRSREMESDRIISRMFFHP